jgi:hypothetical protein
MNNTFKIQKLSKRLYEASKIWDLFWFINANQVLKNLKTYAVTLSLSKGVRLPPNISTGSI